MRHLIILGLVGLAFMSAASVAEAQYGGSKYPGAFYEDQATTPIQGIDYGIARIIRAGADYNVLTSQALLNLSELQRREIENRRLWTETYFAMRRINHDARESERGRRSTEADFIRYAQIGKPRRLNPSELDVITGQIAWPILLRSPELASFRSEVEQVFAQRASNGAINANQFLKVNQMAQMMLFDLRQRIVWLPPAEYVAARRFLESLAYEARLPAI